MELADIVYLLLLFSSIGFGFFYRTIQDIRQKKLIGTLVGLVTIFLVSGIHIVHSLITVFLNALIILKLDKRKCHIISFAFSFLYLFFFRTTEYFGIPYPPDHTNLVQMMLTLKLVGLAFDVNSAYISKQKPQADDRTVEQKLEEASNNCLNELSFKEIFHYSFNYVGVLTGPFIRYRTYKDYFDTAIFKYVDWKGATLKKLKFVPLYCVLFLIASNLWPLSYAKTDEFYNDRSFLYRFWYIWPNFFIFRMRLYIGLILSECVCTMAGFGAYPVSTEPKCGHGPSKNFQELNQILSDEKSLSKTEYDFETIHNINPFGAEFCPTFRESIKHWNMCIQYWLAVNVHKRLPYRKYRTFVTMFVSAIWHGVYTGYYVCICAAPCVFPIENIYVKLILKGRTGTTLYMCEWFMVFFKMFFFSYLSIAFHLLSFNWVMHYYNSIYHVGLIISIVLYFGGIQLLKMKNRAENAAQKLQEKVEVNGKKSI